MLGTLYGDLVACSFKQNGMKLGDELVREDAFFSDKGLMALATADALMIKDRTSPQTFKSLVADYYYGRDKNHVRFPEWFEKWCTPECDYNYDSDCGMAMWKRGQSPFPHFHVFTASVSRFGVSAKNTTNTQRFFYKFVFK